MPTFPSITPSDFDWLAPEYEQVEHETEDGGILHQVMFDTPGNGGLSLTFQNRPYSDYEAILAIHDQTYGSWGMLTLPMATWGGRKSELRTVIATFDPKLEWAFADEPTADGVMNGVCNIQVKLKNRIRPIALSLSAPTLGTPVDPTPEDPGTPADVDTLPVLNCNIVIPIIPDLIGCQPYWASRLTVPIYNSMGQASTSSYVAPNGDNVTSFSYLPPSASSQYYDPFTFIVTKRDKDGTILWTKQTGSVVYDGNGPSFTQLSIYPTNDGGYILGVFNGPGFYYRYTMWKITANGSHVWKKNLVMEGPVNGGIYLTASDTLFLAAFGNSGNGAARRVLISGSTGNVVTSLDINNGYSNRNQAVMVASNGDILLAGRRDGTGFIQRVSPTTLEDLGGYIYTDMPNGIECMLLLEPDVILVSPQNEPNTYFTIGETDLQIINKYITSGLAGNSGTWLFTKQSDGLVYRMRRTQDLQSVQMQAVIAMDFTNLIGQVRNYSYLGWYFRISGSSSVTSTMEYSPASPGHLVYDLAADVNMMVCPITKGYYSSDQPDPELNRVLITSIPLKLPDGSHYFPTDTGTSNYVQVNVSSAEVSMTTGGSLPVETALSASSGIAWTPSNYTATGDVVDALTDFPFESVSDAVCPPKFWTSRLVTPQLASYSIYGGNVVDGLGNSYSCMSYVSAGAVNNNPTTQTLTKRDKDGAILWQIATSPIPVGGFFNFFMHLTTQGVYIGQFNTTGSSADVYYWHVNSSGTQIFHKTYRPTTLGSVAPIQYCTDTGASSLLIMQEQADALIRMNSTTGAIEAGVYMPGNGNPYCPPVKLNNGNYLVVGKRGTEGWIMEFKDNFVGNSGTVDFTPYLVQQYVYSGSAYFTGICAFDNNWLVVGSNSRLYLLSGTNYDVLGMWTLPALPGGMNIQSSVRDIKLGSNGLVHIAFRGNLLYTIDMNNLVAYESQVYSSTFYTFENVHNQLGQRNTLSVANDFGVAWASGGLQAVADGEQHRHIVMGMELTAGQGTWTLNTQPPYTDRYARVTVAGIGTALTPVTPFPTKTVATLPTCTGIGLQTGNTDSERPFNNDPGLVWDLQTYIFT